MRRRILLVMMGALCTSCIYEGYPPIEYESVALQDVPEHVAASLREAQPEGEISSISRETFKGYVRGFTFEMADGERISLAIDGRVRPRTD